MTALSFGDAQIDTLIVLLDTSGKLRLPTDIDTANWKDRRRDNVLISGKIKVLGVRGNVRQGLNRNIYIF